MSKRIPIFLGLFIIGFSIWLLLTPSPFARNLIERLDHLGYDLQLRTRVFTEQVKPQSPVAIIDIDDKSLQALGRWPWNRSQLGQLVDELHDQGAAVIAFDILFSEKQDNITDDVVETLKQKKVLTPTLEKELDQYETYFNEDQLFAESLKKIPSILALGFLPRAQTQNQLPKPILTLSPEEQASLAFINAKGYISNIPIIQNAAIGGGFINIYPDSDGIIRRAPLLIEYQGALYPALALQAVLSYLGESIQLIAPYYHDEKKLEGILIGNDAIPTNIRGEAFIPFIGKSYTFPFYSAVDVMQHTLPKDALLGKILFIGTSATGLGDLHPTSIQTPYPGVEIQATMVNGLLKHHFSYQPEWTFGATFVVILILGLLSAFIFPYLGPRVLSFIILFFPAAILIINNWIWINTGLILSLILPTLMVLLIALLNIIYGYLFETRKREQLKEMFGQYVPARHIDEMLAAKGGLALKGEDRDMSVLFADIRSFTTISEGLTAEQLVNLLNTFFTPMTEIIFKNNGTIDKYVGDLIMAFWGAPLKDKQHAQHAIQSALDMQKKVKDIQPILQKNNWPEIKIGIGINSGNMSVGDMGSQFRRNYTVLGDAVNLASRVESLSKFYGVDIIVTEFTQHNQLGFIFRLLDRVRVKGKKTGVGIYEVIGTQDALTPELKEELALYDKALTLYFAKNFSPAAEIMSQLHHQYPQRKIYSIYLQRIAEFQQQTPPPDWDGVFVHTEK
jgi:adenylate cyclase